MICPICNSTATRVNNTYWCPYDRIYLGDNLAVSTPTPQAPQYPSLTHERSSFVKHLDLFVWVVMGILYFAVIALVAWSYLNGTFGSTSIFG